MSFGRPLKISLREASVLLILILLPGLLLACSSNDEITRSIEEELQVVIEPSGNENPSTAGPAPTMEPFDFPVSDPGYATVHGMLVLMDPRMFLPAEDGIYLVPSAPESDGYLIPPLEDDFPRAVVDERTGEFVVNNVESGTYVLVVASQSGSTFPAHELMTAELVRVIVTPEDMDQTIELVDSRIP